MLKILIVEDHPIFLDALSIAISEAFDVQLTTATSMDEASCALGAGSGFDLVVLDLKVPHSGLFDGLMEIRRNHPETRVLIVSALLTPTIVRAALSEGVSGALPKSSPASEVIAAIDCIVAGDTYLPETYRNLHVPCDGDASELATVTALMELTEQQRRVLKLVIKGLLNKQIAHELGIAERTVKAHVTNILRKLKVGSRTQAALAASRLEELSLLD